MLEKAAKCCLITVAGPKLYIRTPVLLRCLTPPHSLSTSLLFCFSISIAFTMNRTGELISVQSHVDNNNLQ